MPWMKYTPDAAFGQALVGAGHHPRVRRTPCRSAAGAPPSQRHDSTRSHSGDPDCCNGLLGGRRARISQNTPTIRPNGRPRKDRFINAEIFFARTCAFSGASESLIGPSRYEARPRKMTVTARRPTPPSRASAAFDLRRNSPTKPRTTRNAEPASRKPSTVPIRRSIAGPPNGLPFTGEALNGMSIIHRRPSPP